MKTFHAINFLPTKAGAAGNHWASLLSKYPSPDVEQCNGNNYPGSIKQNSNLFPPACLNFIFPWTRFAQDLNWANCLTSGKGISGKKHWNVQWLLLLEEVAPTSQARALGLGFRQAWAGILASTPSSPITLGKLLNSLNFNLFSHLKSGDGKRAHIPLLSWGLLEKMLVKPWKKGLRYNKASISSGYCYHYDDGYQQKKMGIIIVQPMSTQWKTSTEGGMWTQELIMLNSKHAEFKATDMWVYKIE